MTWRSEAIERMAKALHWRDELSSLPGDPPADHWELLDAATRVKYREEVSLHVDALGDLEPVEREGARTEIVNQHGLVVTRGPWQHRYVTAWTEA
ncbi:hypothetical protein [Nocardia sp. CC227C]|uniref:hypothetical protein n=1 Tax=Nocardia sp. CC227C TaxID=3044562 RepID=UPI00278C81A7|nr:hypothetical protein [Nocardia sp. CC227C]